MTASDDDRIAYLSGEHAESLSAEDRADLDELRVLLRTPSAWAEPGPDLEDRVVAAIAAEASATGRGAESGSSDTGTSEPTKATSEARPPSAADRARIRRRLNSRRPRPAGGSS